MTSPISGASGTNSTAAAGADKAKSKELGDKDTFLKLLVAQLKYQDPSNPADSTQFMAQTAQFTQVEKLSDIADLLKSQRMVGASGLVGHTVTYMDEAGTHQEGVVAAAKLNGDAEPLLHIGNMDVPLSKIMEVQTMAAGGASAAATAATTPRPSTPPAAPPAAPATKPATGSATA
jgi:flagellar basal-body rod modification protein FlgD